MKKHIKLRIVIAVLIILSLLAGIVIGIKISKSEHFDDIWNKIQNDFWGYDFHNRQGYTTKQIEDGAIGATLPSDGKDYKNSSNYPGTIIFNSILDSEIGDERDFVSVRKDTSINIGASINWENEKIQVEDGKTYIIRLYIHNNNPNGLDAIAKDTRIFFFLTSKSSKVHFITGAIQSSNASPESYEDNVYFISDIPFHFEYIKGSARLENGGIGANGGVVLNDDIVEFKSDRGVLIGYDSLDGRIPGGSEYISYITIKVTTVFDREFTTEMKVNNHRYGVWDKFKEINTGDSVEFQIEYANCDSVTHQDVIVKSNLPANFEYIEGTTVLYNEEHKNGIILEQDTISKEGVNIGDYSAGSSAYVRFRARNTNSPDEDFNVAAITGEVKAGNHVQIIEEDLVAITIQKEESPIIASISVMILLLLILYGFFIEILFIMNHKIKNIDDKNNNDD